MGITQEVTPVTPLSDFLSPDRPDEVDNLVEVEIPRLTDELGALIPEINETSAEVQNNADAANADAASASNSALIALGSTNYKGDWIPDYNTTGYSLNMSVSYTDGYNYVSKIDNNLTEPTTLTNTSEWNFIENVNPNNYYTKTESDNLLDDKASQDTTYTKTESDNLLDDKASQDTTYTKTETDNLLVAKVPKTAQVIAWELANSPIGENGVDIGGGETLYPNGDVKGTNANGSYLKSASGELTCRASLIFTLDTTLMLNGTFYEGVAQTWTLPYVGISGEYASAEAKATSTLPYCVISSFSTTQVLFFITNNISTATKTYGTKLFFKGRWK